MSKSNLEKIYRDTIYSVFNDDKQYDLKIGEVMPLDLQCLLNNEKYAVILTAWNPQSQAFSLSENQLRNNKLSSMLNHYQVFKALGQVKDSSWQAEESFFIVGIKHSEVEKLAANYKQYAYVLCEKDNAVSLNFTKLWHTEMNVE